MEPMLADGSHSRAPDSVPDCELMRNLVLFTEHLRNI
jgi:hypothetical protein